MQQADVAIVGGGPAGSAAGQAAASQGADAVVVEKGVPRADRDGPGPDSTDAAGMLDYWVDLMALDEPIPDEVVLQELDAAEFDGPTESVRLESTGIDATYDGFGFTFHRARMDDWLRDLAKDAGASYRVGTGVESVDVGGTTEPHRITLADGTDLSADRLILADGPSRTQTLPVLEELLPDGPPATIQPDHANHIAYQEHRRFPPELFDEGTIRFWWGYIPGETAYPWVFPNDDGVARVGLTMPTDLNIDEIDRDAYALLDPDDETIPPGRVYLRRLLERVYPDYDIGDFPLVEDRGKRGGVEAYPISSTRPIESPVGADVAIAGGAMGTTSAFHEGGYHVAVRTGSIAGELAATGRLQEYNDRWHAAIGAEVVRNVVFADLVEDYEPADWDRAFATASDLLSDAGGLSSWRLRSGVTGLRAVLAYRLGKWRYRNGRYAQIRESDYVY
jgi:electron-transferring-flavoprotein dehydrogenase